MKSLLRRFDQGVGAASRLCGWAAAALTLVIASLLVINVVLRVTASPIIGVVDLTKFGMLAIVMLALPYTHRVQAHIRIKLVTDRFPARTQARVEIVAQLLTGVTTLYIAYLYLARTLIGATSFGQGLLHIPEMPFRILIVIGFALWAVEAFCGAAKAAPGLRTVQAASNDRRDRK
jgi:TRAP-type C4-dicarboxylate transport system permease small subunit